LAREGRRSSRVKRKERSKKKGSGHQKEYPQKMSQDHPILVWESISQLISREKVL